MTASIGRVRRQRGQVATFTLVAAVALCGGTILGQRDFGRGQVLPFVQARELALKISEPFTLASVGDLIIMRPASVLAETGFQSAIKIIRDADVAFGNFEGSIADLEHFDGPLRGFTGTKQVAADVKAMGFDLVNRANNHLFDSEVEGMWATNTLLDQAGLVHAGSGRNLDDARAARYLETPKGRVGLVGMHTANQDGRLAATPRVGNIGGRPGLNGLGLTTWYNVTREQLEGLKKLRSAVYAPPKGMSHAVEQPKDDPADQLLLFGLRYKVGTPGLKSYTMNPNDLRGILRTIRNGKHSADFMIATIHAHQGPWVAQRWAYEENTPDFLIELAHQSIDNGADAFVGHGPHVVRGVEIYNGKPIFYGLGEFFREMDLALVERPVGQDMALRELTDVELLKRNREAGDVRAPIMYESLLAESRYQGGRLAEVRLHPMELGYSKPVSRVGIPRTATGETAQRILSRVQALSKPFGTTIEIQGDIGVIKVPGSTTTAARQAPPSNR